MSNWNGNASSWQYSRWVRNAARNARITNPTGLEELIYRICVAYFYDPVANTGTRPWLKDRFFVKATAAAPGSAYQCNIATEPISVIGELLDVVGRDLKKLPVTNAEKAVMDVLGWIQESVVGYRRRLGTGPVFGGTSGSVITVP
jgi:hypothetical protein